MIIREFPWRNPVAAFAPLAGSPGAHLLHAGDRCGGGWSIIAAFPAAELKLSGDNCSQWLHNLRALIESRARNVDPSSHRAAPFVSGLIGYIGYEALAGLERSLALPQTAYALADAQFGVYDAAAAFDRETCKATLVGHSESAMERLEAALGEGGLPETPLPEFGPLSSNFSMQGYEAAVGEVIERIRNGDLFQANIAQTLKAKAHSAFSSLSIFQRVASASDAFFSALLQYEDGDIISNSPERFFKLSQDGYIGTEPIKGTRPRGSDEEEDRALAAELLGDGKDRAENIMIADLMRNDLSWICADHSVREEAICELMTLSRVHHLVSRISGKLRPDADIVDAITSLMPSGSITGAPKIEAMRLIGETEKTGRGPYCGAIGYIDDRGHADFSVAIRTMMTDQSRREIFIPVGGGITLRSEPHGEREETLVKARAALAALGLSAEGLV